MLDLGASRYTYGLYPRIMLSLLLSRQQVRVFAPRDRGLQQKQISDLEALDAHACFSTAAASDRCQITQMGRVLAWGDNLRPGSAAPRGRSADALIWADGGGRRSALEADGVVRVIA